MPPLDPRTQVKVGDTVSVAFIKGQYEVVGFLHRLHALNGSVVLRPKWADNAGLVLANRADLRPGF